MSASDVPSLSKHSIATLVPADFFDELLAALDRPPVADKALRRAAKRGRDLIERR
jgi:uncharacterized protein (DUF1778 family)